MSQLPKPTSPASPDPVAAPRLETLLVRAGAEVDPASGAIAPPIHLSTTFEHGPAGEEPFGYSYVRVDNPTQRRLEEALAIIEGGEGALVFGSGLGAAAACLQSLEPGGHVLYGNDVYHGTRDILREFCPRWGLAASEVDLADLDAVGRALRPETRMVWAETPTNPSLRIADLAALARLAHDARAELVVDSTFATPVLQRPLELGADRVLHSTTKYLGGHSDVQGGALVFARRDQTFDAVARLRLTLGAVASPFNSWLVLRGLRSLACRMERHSANAAALATALEAHPRVEKVFYPGLPSHPGHEIARRQMSAFGGMLSLSVAGTKTLSPREAALAVAARVRLMTNATSLGGTETLIEHRASTEGPHSPTPDNLLRISVGLEHADDLIADLVAALDALVA